MNEILKKIDEARNTLWMSRNRMFAGAIAETIDLLNEAEKLIQSDQKEPCQGCKHITDENGYCQYCKRAYSDEYQSMESEE